MGGDRQEMPEEKQRAVMMAAMREFADKGYEQGSTNVISREAGISKGLLFHYFGNKKSLFLATLDECYDFVIDYYYRHIPKLSPDLMERLLQGTRVKFRMFREHRDHYRFLMMAQTIQSEEIRSELEARRERLHREHWVRFFEGVDYSRFREDIDRQKGIEILMLMLESIGNQYVDRFREQSDYALDQLEHMMDEMKDYLKIMRYGLYKEEGRRRDSAE